MCLFSCGELRIFTRSGKTSFWLFHSWIRSPNFESARTIWKNTPGWFRASLDFSQLILWKSRGSRFNAILTRLLPACMCGYASSHRIWKWPDLQHAFRPTYHPVLWPILGITRTASHNFFLTFRHQISPTPKKSEPNTSLSDSALQSHNPVKRSILLVTQFIRLAHQIIV